MLRRSASSLGSVQVSRRQARSAHPRMASPFRVGLRSSRGDLAADCVLALFTGLVGGAKARRRKGRRNTGTPSMRVAGGWHEVIDLAADMGSPIPVLATRNEGARLMGTDAAVGLARHADVGIFGDTSLTDDWVGTYWDDVNATRTAMTADMSKMERWKVLVSLASLRIVRPLAHARSTESQARAWSGQVDARRSRCRRWRCR